MLTVRLEDFRPVGLYMPQVAAEFDLVTILVPLKQLHRLQDGVALWLLPQVQQRRSCSGTERVRQ
jgi:hypothetical protein